MGREAQLIYWAPEVFMRTPSRQQLEREILLSQRAHEMRTNATRSESALWAALSRGQLGVAFRRQVPIGSQYIADFVAPAVKLIIEVDGTYHRRRVTADARRTRGLERLGYRVLRLDAEVVLRQLPVALEAVRQALQVGRVLTL
jgi:very-short-patch-repair endonuclease